MLHQSFESTGMYGPNVYGMYPTGWGEEAPATDSPETMQRPMSADVASRVVEHAASEPVDDASAQRRPRHLTHGNQISARNNSADAAAYRGGLGH